jgi:hypothetical protein
MVGHLDPERHGLALLRINAVHFLAEQHVRLNGVDLVALLDLGGLLR